MTGARPTPYLVPRPVRGRIARPQPLGLPVINMGFNELPDPPTPAVAAAIAGRAATLGSYGDPGCDAVRAALGATWGLDPDRLICGNGSEELLDVIARVFVRAGDEIVVSQFGYIQFALTAHRLGARLRSAPETDLRTDTDALLATITPATRLVFLANPNNPTGTYLDRDELRRLHRGLRDDILLVIDSAYAEYVTADDYGAGEELVREAENVVMVRTFSKIGLAALRIGWMFGSERTVDAVNRLRGPFNVSLPAQIAGEAAARDVEFIAGLRAHNDTWRRWLSTELAGNSIRVVPSQGNFILALFADGTRARKANEELLANGLVVREMTSYGLENGLRISIGRKNAMRALAGVLTGLDL